VSDAERLARQVLREVLAIARAKRLARERLKGIEREVKATREGSRTADATD
jgi:hypothetical protein